MLTLLFWTHLGFGAAQLLGAVGAVRRCAHQSVQTLNKRSFSQTSFVCSTLSVPKEVQQEAGRYVRGRGEDLKRDTPEYVALSLLEDGEDKGCISDTAKRFFETLSDPAAKRWCESAAHYWTLYRIEFQLKLADL